VVVVVLPLSALCHHCAARRRAMTAMVAARIEQKPEQLCAGDEFEEVGYAKQLRSQMPP